MKNGGDWGALNLGRPEQMKEVLFEWNDGKVRGEHCGQKEQPGQRA